MKFFYPKYPSILRSLYPGRISRLKDTNSIYLTFDDGPVPEVTPWVLEQLKKYNARATFFCIGENVKKNPEIFRQIIKEGHAIGNHTYNHLNGWATSTRPYLDNIERCETIMNGTGESLTIPSSQLQINPGKLFRPPYGRIKNSQARLLVKKGYKIVMWDVISGDYDNSFSAENCLSNVIDHATGGSTIVFHDSKKAFKNLKEILPEVLKYYDNKGFKFRGITDVP